MGRLVMWVLLIVVVVVIAGAIYLATADVPAPVTHVEKVLPNEPAAP